jgi:hypothetical protein
MDKPFNRQLSGAQMGRKSGKSNIPQELLDWIGKRKMLSKTLEGPNSNSQLYF